MFRGQRFLLVFGTFDVAVVDEVPESLKRFLNRNAAAA
jgi:hypothetical protein